MSDDAIERLHENWSDGLPRGQLDWKDETRTVLGLEIIVSGYEAPEHVDRGGFLPGIFGLVVSPRETVETYVEDHADGTIDIPQYYSDFPEGDSMRVNLYERGGDAVRAAPLESAIRELNGSGRYRKSEFTLYDCLGGDAKPCPIVRENVGCILLAPMLGPE